MWSDHESDIDYLNFLETSELISDLVSNPTLRPVSIGVFGGWGSGKSTLIKLSKQDLATNPDYVIVDFDAWLYQDFDDARAALLEAVSKSLLEAAQKNESAAKKAKSLFKRVNKLRALGLLAEGGALLMGTPAFGMLYKGFASAGDIVSGEGDQHDLENAKAAVKDASAAAKGLINPKEDVTPPQEITAFREEFSALLTELDKTLVVYVDNLDRCLPRNAVLTLEAIRLILFMPNTAFVIAADEDMIRLAVSEHYKTSQTRLINDYLDKLIQVPIQVPRLGIAEVTSYSFLLLLSLLEIPIPAKKTAEAAMQSSLRKLWQKPLITTTELLSAIEAKHSLSTIQRAELENAYRLSIRLAPMLANSRRVLGNPRIVKRLLNTVWLRASIAKKRGMPTVIDKALIAKIALFERCAGERASAELYRLINDATTGKPKLITTLEKQETIMPRDVPDAWEDIDFINNWIKLEPKLSGVDLRAVAYLARETLPMRLSIAGLSAEAESAVQILSKAESVSSPATVSTVNKLPVDEYLPVMEALIEHLTKTTSWNKNPNGFSGAVVLARKSDQAGKKMRSFILSLGKTPGWMNILIKDDNWWKESV